MKKLFFNHRKGFTLIEILVVVVLIGVLTAAVIVYLKPGTQFEKGRDTQRKNDLAQISRALEQYYNDVGNYPNTSGSSNYYIVDGVIPRAWGTSGWTYFDLLPKDPLTSQRYIYHQALGGQAYYLYAHLERPGDAGACTTAGIADCDSISANGIPANACSNPAGTLSCNYAVSSPNVSP